VYLNPSHAIPISRPRRQTSPLYWCFLLLLCSAYLQGGLEKMLDYPGAMAEMRHFGMQPAGLFALLTIVGELGASLMILAGRLRWMGALYLALFTLAANFLANRFWGLEGMARTMSENGFFEHLGLVGAFLIVAWIDLQAGHALPGSAGAAQPAGNR
jgi:uncharacterized membrane protein YphA (DoxX/SURF4 family)